MGKASGIVTYNNFIKGLITEASELNFPPNSSLDEDNLVLERKGNRRRRLGVDYVTGTSLSSNTFALPSSPAGVEFSYYWWRSVAGDGAVNYLVFQINTVLYFYDSVTLSQITTLDLTSRGISGAANMGRDKVKMVALNGKLFVVGKQITPFYVTATAGVLSYTAISLQIRDFDGISDGLTVDNRPATLSDSHNYNLKNQGWNVTAGGVNPVTVYFGIDAVYPSNAQIWFVGKDSSDVFTPALLDKQEFGNTPAPKGHFLLDPFNKDRATASGIAGLTTESVTVRPSVVESFAGRIWYAGLEADKINGNLYFSQILKDNLTNVGNCYQAADPTAEDDSLLVDDDGGVVNIAKVGRILGLKASQDTMLIFGDNGVWAISGSSGAGFKATDFQLYQVTTAGCIAKDSIVEVEITGQIGGFVSYWSSKGIYGLTKNTLVDRYVAASLTDKIIQSFYDGIDAKAVVNVQAFYDEKRRQLNWFYNGDANDTSYKRQRILTYDVTLSAFTKSSISPIANSSPYVLGAIDYNNGTDWYISSMGLLSIVPGSGTFKFIFTQFKNRQFVDWKTFNSTGISYSSYLESGYEYGGDLMRNKEITYIMSYFKRTEGAYVATGAGDYAFDYPSSCLLTTKWEWTDGDQSNRWSSAQQAYKIKRQLLPDTNDLSYDDGVPVVVTKNRVRGKGHSLRYRYESEEGKDFNLLGWATQLSGETAV